MSGVLALDLGLHTGWAGITPAQRFSCGVEELNPEEKPQPNGVRFSRFRGWLEAKLDELGAGHLAYEEPWSHHRSGAQAKLANGLLAVAQEVAADRSLQLDKVAVTSLKKWAAGNGHAEKPELLAAARRRWGGRPEWRRYARFLGTHDDAVDSLWALNWYVHTHAVGRLERPVGWPTGTYNVIYVDPPTDFENWSKDRMSKHGSVANHYETLSTEELMRLPVHELASPDWCVLILWSSVVRTAEGDHARLMRSWGFRPTTRLFSWRKVYADGAPYCGMGFYTRSGSEDAWLGTRGSGCSKVLSRSILEDQRARVNGHSTKPPIFYQRIEELWGDVPRVELFARRRWPGWDAWGNETELAMPLFDGLELPGVPRRETAATVQPQGMLFS